jgi:hypothetical protein
MSINEGKGDQPCGGRTTGAGAAGRSFPSDAEIGGSSRDLSLNSRNVQLVGGTVSARWHLRCAGSRAMLSGEREGPPHRSKSRRLLVASMVTRNVRRISSPQSPGHGAG